MSTHADTLAAKAEAARAARDAAGIILLQMLGMVGITLYPGTTIETSIHDRRIEAVVEHPRSPSEIKQAYSKFRRAQSQERKARSAAHIARLTAEANVDLQQAPRRPKKPKRIKIGLDADEALRGLRELRA